jgi:O-antigen/teichoic acid export membrane protein
VTPDITTDTAAEAEKTIPSTAGMTTRVAKGSIWTLAGQVLPLFASLVTTPLIIRMLGSEGYGVLILIGLIPTYFSFSELGMGMASTRFASEAYARGDLDEEARAIRTAALIALICSTIVAVPIAVFAEPIIRQFNVPEELRGQAVMGLRICSATFVTAIICGVVNTAQLTRLRMDLNAAINGISKVLSSLGTVLVLFLGGGIVGAAVWFLAIGLINVAAHILVSGKLLRQFLDISIDRRLISPLLRFGAGLAMSAVAAVLLVNLEKLLVGRLISVQSLAFYSIAYTFASMATLFSTAMIQSLVPAFSQLLAPEKRQQFNDLFSRSLKLSIILLLPSLMVLFVVAKPFFTLWAGPDFGRESPGPFYILLGGLFFNIIAFIPWASIVSVGRTDLMAKIHWSEVVPYIICAALLINYFGIIGAALAWSLRVASDSVVQLWFSRKVAGAPTELRRTVPATLLGILILAPSPLIAVLYDNYSPLLLLTATVSVAVYLAVSWRVFITSAERDWVAAKLPPFLRRPVLMIS